MAAKPFSATITRTYLNDTDAAAKGLSIVLKQQWQPKETDAPEQSNESEKTSA